MKKKISILGSTGSIGLSALSIIEKEKNKFKPYIFSANKNYSLICKQIKKFKPVFFVIKDHKIFEKVSNWFKKNKIKIFKDFNFLKRNKCHLTISAIPGIAGLEPTLKMISNSQKILIANKESIICGWKLISNKAKKKGTQLIPIDS